MKLYTVKHYGVELTIEENERILRDNSQTSRFTSFLHYITSVKFIKATRWITKLLSSCTFRVKSIVDEEILSDP